MTSLCKVCLQQLFLVFLLCQLVLVGGGVTADQTTDAPEDSTGTTAPEEVEPARAGDSATTTTTTTTTLTTTSGKCIPQSLQVGPQVTSRKSRKLVIAHRGASYHLPEHTLAAYRTALSLGADWIELDIVSSADRTLWCLHTTDLAVTTNVVEVFGKTKQPWFCPVMNRSSYWIFNFTAAELDQLTVKQRIPTGRSTMYDGVWKIPRLEEALRVLHSWNSVSLPATLPPSQVTTTATVEDDGTNRRPTPLALAQAGLYLELKEANLLLQAANIDLPNLLLHHIGRYPKLWADLLENQCYTALRFDQYKVPGLVLQSFDIEALQSFHSQWSDHFSNDLAVADNTHVKAAPEPPYVLLVNDYGCTDMSEDFWVKMGDEWAGLLSGIGCDKQCLLGERGAEFALKAQEFKLVLHPWTERPENEYVLSTFQSSLEEMQHLFCNVAGVEAVFDESVSIAVLATQLGCPNGTSTGTGSGGTSGGEAKDSSTMPDLCYDNSTEADAYTSLAAFVMGVFLTSLVTLWLGRKRRRRYGDGRVVPTADENIDGDLELS